MSKTRIKTHAFPGSIPKEEKIFLLEKEVSKRAKSFKKNRLLVRERAILKRATRKEIEYQKDN